MKVCIFSLDKKANEIGSPVQRRLAALAAEAGEIEVITPNDAIRKLSLFFRKRFDLISVQDTAYFALFAYLIARICGIPFEVQVHGFEKFSGLRRLIAGFVLKYADKIRVVSERLKEEVKKVWGIKDNKIYILSVYVQNIPPRLASRDTPPQLRRGLNGEFIFLTVGRLVPVKNIGMQIRAFAKIADEFPNARLRIVGDGPERPALQLTTDNLHLTSRIIFEGQQKDMARFYQNSDAFILTSDSEGWGVAIVEAAAHGLPIVMTDVGCAGEFIKNGENGIVIPVGNENALVSAIKRLISDEPFRFRLGASARATFLGLPSPEAHIQKQVQEWKTIV